LAAGLGYDFYGFAVGISSELESSNYPFFCWTGAFLGGGGITSSSELPESIKTGFFLGSGLKLAFVLISGTKSSSPSESSSKIFGFL
jgi:hypothetical protein